MILDDIVAKKKEDLKNNPLNIKELEKKIANLPKPRDFYNALLKDELSIIAEVKKASPSKGIICEHFNPLQIAKEYEKAGANAISVLTEEHFFMGSNSFLTEIKQNGSLPVLRKDFIIEEKQIIEARAIGADAILFIAAILDEKTMLRLYLVAKEYDLHCLFEAHNKEELLKINACGAKIVGINNRDLNTFEVSLQAFCALSPLIPDGCVKVAESGIFTGNDAKTMKQNGANALLVGEALMKANSIEEAIKELKNV